MPSRAVVLASGLINHQQAVFKGGSLMDTNRIEITQKDIDRLVERGGRFLRAIGTKAGIRRQMAALGYNDDQHDQGWRMYLTLCGYRAPNDRQNTIVPEDQATRDIINKIDNWDEPYFARAHAALNHYFPQQEAYLFQNLTAQKGIAAIGSVKTFLDRVKIMREGTDSKRAQYRDQDREAVKLLEQRQIISAESEKYLYDLIGRVQKFVEVKATAITNEDADYHQHLQETAVQFKYWLDDWRATARAGITRRDYLISLGLATRRQSNNGEVIEEVEENTPIAGQPNTVKTTTGNVKG